MRPPGARPRRRVVMQWHLSSFFGWGVYGLNLALNWASDPDIELLCGVEIRDRDVVIDAVRRHALEPCLTASNQLHQELAKFAGQAIDTNVPVLVGLLNDFTPGTRCAHDTVMKGKPEIGVVFFEIPQLEAGTLERARRYPLIVTGSTWNQDILREYGISQVETVIQGVDTTLFHPAPAAGYLKDRFLIFSAGNLELRKGQDIVLTAFRIFAERHPEALLVTAWHSPWPEVARNMELSRLVTPVPMTADGKLDVKGWAAANGVGADRVLDLGNVHNAQLPPILREMDVAVFANRSEGGTNLMAMEAMACGLPVVLSRNTGHLDLIRPDNCFALDRQRAINGSAAGVGGTPGWGDSDVDEVVEALETVWRDREEARRRGARAAEMMSGLTWAHTARRMKEVILSCC